MELSENMVITNIYININVFFLLFVIVISAFIFLIAIIVVVIIVTELPYNRTKQLFFKRKYFIN